MERKLLDKVTSPKDLKNMSMDDLNVLSEEISEYILDVVSKNGGHLASNLGIVDLTLALHTAFDCPTDKLIWDVGHQSYTHKIITGRKEEFKTLRQYGGLSGFPKRSESEYDVFETGHSSTSISAGLGIIRGLRLRGDMSKVISVIGDGALTGGMAWEAINDLGHAGDNLIIVLNDNSMSISQNVGAVSNYLTKIRISKGYNRFKRDLVKFLDHIPKIGSPIFGFLEHIKNSLKYLMSGGRYFEDIGLKYVGPVDGHNIKKMTETFKAASQYVGPVIIHVVTKKGKGYKIAEGRPDKYHSTGAFDTKTGDPFKSKIVTPASIIGETLCNLAKDDDKICAITAAMTNGCGLSDFEHYYPNRFFDVAIAEQHGVTMAGGLAVAGFKPVFCVYSSFLQRAYDQLITDVCLQNLNVVFAISHSGLVSGDGETHQGVFDYSYLRLVPNLSILIPSTLKEVSKMLKQAFDIDGPVAICYPKAGLPESLPLGERQNGDVLLLTMGRMRSTGIAVKEELAGKLNVDVENVSILKPLNIDYIESIVCKYKLIYVIEDNLVAGGFYSSVMEKIQDNLGCRIHSIALNDDFVPHGDMSSIEEKYGMDYKSIANKLLKEHEIG